MKLFTYYRTLKRLKIGPCLLVTYLIYVVLCIDIYLKMVLALTETLSTHLKTLNDYIEFKLCQTEQKSADIH
jgi:hypothetical protein